MKIKSIYAKSFYSDRLSNTKYQEIHTFAQNLINQKNYLSTIVNNNLTSYLCLTKYEFYKNTLPLLKSKVNSHFVKQLQEDVYIAYINRFEQIVNRLNFKQIYDYRFIYYARNSKHHKKGELKSISKKYKSTPLSITLSFLAKSNLTNPIDYIKQKLLTERNQDKIKFYTTILSCIEKFSLARLQKLALSKRNRIIKYYTQTPIVFKSLTFRGRSRLSSNIVSYNTNFNSSIKAFINISWNI